MAIRTFAESMAVIQRQAGPCAESAQKLVDALDPERCMCAEPDDCMHFDCGYPWCRSCGEHHRAPECDVDELGRSLSPLDGTPWVELGMPTASESER